ncbi:MAG: hypothetical protein ABSC05_23680 [Candidatus Solibacter sp.]|jgi:hypothetical protein
MRTELEFIPEPGEGMSLKLVSGAVGVEADRTVLVRFDPKDLPQYVGAYRSEELEMQCTVILKDGKLTIDDAHHGEAPVAKDEFRCSAAFMPEVKLLRDSAGKVTGVTFGGNRIAGVRFVRR